MRSCFVSVMAAIFSRSSMVSERVTRLRTLLMKRSSSSLRAASAGDRVRLRVMRLLLASVSAFTICSSLTSPARADPVAAAQASAAPSSAQTVLNFRFPVCAAIVTLPPRWAASHSPDGIPEELVDDIGLNVYGCVDIAIAAGAIALAPFGKPAAMRGCLIWVDAEGRVIIHNYT